MRDGPGSETDESRLNSEPTSSLRLALTRVWWMPIAFIAAALMLLLLTPIVVDHLVTLLRRDVVDVADEARVQVNDLQTAFVAGTYAHDAGAGRTDRVTDSAETANVGKELRDAQSLDSLVRQLGQEPTRRLDTLQARSRQWHRLLQASARRTPRSTSSGGPTSARDTALVRRGLDVLAAAEALDDELLSISIAARDRVRYFAQLNMIATLALTPLAMIALALVVWMGRRILAMASEIDRERTALRIETQARAALVRGVTHDVKNPLGAAIGYVGLLQEGLSGAVTEEQMRILTRIRRLTGVALTTIDELLDVARLEAHDGRPGSNRVDLAAVLAELVEDYRAAAHERGIRLTNESEPQGIALLTDAAHVRRIIGNLLSNGIKYSRRGGRVSVAVRLDVGAGAGAGTRRCVITVCDDGPGIAEEFREQLFRDFARAPGAALQADGHGLGLAASRRLAIALGGDLRLTESPLGGAGFLLELPA
jgi:signal transduction histidine kinase